MTKTLVYINPDLASSIALRYACKLAKLTGMALQTMHVVEPEQEGSTPGTGWVRRTWEKGLLETAQMEISRLINAERASCHSLGAPKMNIGICEDEILRELQEEGYDLYVEGALYSFDPSGLSRRIRSKLYREAPCPILLVKNLVSPKKIVLMLDDETDPDALISTFLALSSGADIKPDLLHYRFQASPSTTHDSRNEILNSAEKMLSAKGCSVIEKRAVHDSPARVSEHLKDYGLVVLSLSGKKSTKKPLVELLNMVPSAILMCGKQN